MKNLKLISFLLAFLFFASNCKKGDSPQADPGSSVKIIKENLVLNPSGYSPLAIVLDVADSGGDKAKFSLGSYFGHASAGIPQKPFMMDQFGDIRWYLNYKQHPDFDWNWYQHSVKLLPNGNILLFDNGPARNFSDEDVYSRAVEYQIDPINQKVKEIWAYGEERGLETYSRIVSSVEYLADENRIVFAPGAIAIGGEDRAKVVEIDYTSGAVLFEATIRPPSSFATITFHQTRRVAMYE